MKHSRAVRVPDLASRIVLCCPPPVETRPLTRSECSRLFALLKKPVNGNGRIVGGNHPPFSNDWRSESDSLPQSIPAGIHAAVPKLFGDIGRIISVQYARSRDGLFIHPHNPVFGSIG